MRTIGSLTLCRSLLNAGLVDRFRVVVFPVITGRSGRDRIYDGYPDVALELLSNRTFDGRLQLLEYNPTVLTGPPAPTRTRPEVASSFAPSRDLPDQAQEDLAPHVLREVGRLPIRDQHRQRRGAETERFAAATFRDGYAKGYKIGPVASR